MDDEGLYRRLASEVEASTKSVDDVEITSDGHSEIRQHFAQDFLSSQTKSGSFANNDERLRRMEQILSGELQPTQTDLYFFSHELDESRLMRSLIQVRGMSPQDAYDLAHVIICKQYGVTAQMVRGHVF